MDPLYVNAFRDVIRLIQEGHESSEKYGNLRSFISNMPWYFVSRGYDIAFVSRLIEENLDNRHDGNGCRQTR